MNMSDQTIILTWPDHAELTLLVESRRYRPNTLDGPAFERLAAELSRAKLVASGDIPTNVVTMNTRFRARDLDTNEELTLTMSWPDEADVNRGCVNVLAPLGMALLGCRVGQDIDWPVPGGHRRLRVEAVLYQPEHDVPVAAC